MGNTPSSAMRAADLINVEGILVPRSYCKPTQGRDDDVRFPVKLRCTKHPSNRCTHGAQCFAVHFVQVNVDGKKKSAGDYEACTSLSKAVALGAEVYECPRGSLCHEQATEECSDLHPLSQRRDKAALAEAKFYFVLHLNANRGMQDATNDGGAAADEEAEEEAVEDEWGDEEDEEEEEIDPDTIINVEGMFVPYYYLEPTIGSDDQEHFPVKRTCSNDGCDGENCAAVHFVYITVDGKTRCVADFEPSPAVRKCVFDGKNGRACWDAKSGSCPRTAEECRFLHPNSSHRTRKGREAALSHFNAWLEEFGDGGDDDPLSVEDDDDTIEVDGVPLPRYFCVPTPQLDDDERWPTKQRCTDTTCDPYDIRSRCLGVHIAKILIEGVPTPVTDFQSSPALMETISSRGKRGNVCRYALSRSGCRSNAKDCRFLHPVLEPIVWKPAVRNVKLTSAAAAPKTTRDAPQPASAATLATTAVAVNSFKHTPPIPTKAVPVSTSSAPPSSVLPPQSMTAPASQAAGALARSSAFGPLVTVVRPQPATSTSAPMKAPTTQAAAVLAPASVFGPPVDVRPQPAVQAAPQAPSSPQERVPAQPSCGECEQLRLQLVEAQQVIAEKEYEADVLHSRMTTLDSNLRAARTSNKELAAQVEAREAESKRLATLLAEAEKGEEGAVASYRATAIALSKEQADRASAQARANAAQDKAAAQAKRIAELEAALFEARQRQVETDALSATTAAALQRRDPAELCERSEAYYAAGQHVKAMNNAATCIDHSPEYKRAYIAYGRAAIALGDFHGAAVMLQAGLKRVVGGGEQTETIRSLHEIATTAPGIVAKALHQWKMNNESEAQHAIQPLLKQDCCNRCWDIHFPRALSLIAMLDLVDNSEAIEEVIACFGPARRRRCANFHFLAGYYGAWQGKLKEALDGDFAEALQIDPKHELTLSYVKKCKEALSREESAEKAAAASNWKQVVHFYTSAAAVFKRNFNYAAQLRLKETPARAKLGQWNEVLDNLMSEDLCIHQQPELVMLRGLAALHLDAFPTRRLAIVAEALEVAKKDPSYIEQYRTAAKLANVEPAL